ncbi:MAG: small ribosomal subunit Rsm22 family protein [Bdellovibrionales bacterium]
MSIRMQKLSPPFEALVRTALSKRGFDIGHVGPGPRETFSALSNAVMELSDFYLKHPGDPTPWGQDSAFSAYIAYFMPLNFVRLRDAFREVKRFLRPDAVSEIWDFGAGLGTTQWVLESEQWLAPRPLYTLEVSREAESEHENLLRIFPAARWSPQRALHKPRPPPGALAVFSYSFLEMPSYWNELERFDHLLIVEPSTRDCGRQLMWWRQRWIQMGFEPLAPCTHAFACPLLTHSARDWCHDRVKFEAPLWWLELEEHLPMKNRTLTYSYLLLSRTSADSRWRGQTRVIGDTLNEKGKTRQLICRGSKREFLSWLHRQGEPPQIPHGALISNLEGEMKGQEVRVVNEIKFTI